MRGLIFKQIWGKEGVCRRNVLSKHKLWKMWWFWWYKINQILSSTTKSLLSSLSLNRPTKQRTCAFPSFATYPNSSNSFCRAFWIPRHLPIQYPKRFAPPTPNTSSPQNEDLRAATYGALRRPGWLKRMEIRGSGSIWGGWFVVFLVVLTSKSKNFYQNWPQTNFYW